MMVLDEREQMLASIAIIVNPCDSATLQALHNAVTLGGAIGGVLRKPIKAG